MVRKHLLPPRRLIYDDDNDGDGNSNGKDNDVDNDDVTTMERVDFVRSNLEITRLTRTEPDLSEMARPDSMARILVSPAKCTSSSGVAKASETSAATVTRRVVQPARDSSSVLPICEIRMTSKLKSLLQQGRQEEGERLMMPPPPPPAPRPLSQLPAAPAQRHAAQLLQLQPVKMQVPQLLKLSKSFTMGSSLDEIEDDLVKVEPQIFGLGGGSELELLAEAAIASDPREEDFYDSNGKDNAANLGRTVSISMLRLLLTFNVDFGTNEQNLPQPFLKLLFGPSGRRGGS